MTLGGDVDDPEDENLAAGMRIRNSWTFGNVTCSLNEAVAFMLETERLKTRYQNGSDEKIFV